MKKGYIYCVLTLIIILVVFNLIAFMPGFEHTPTFWAGYGFSLAAILLAFVCTLTAFSGDRRSIFLGLPLMHLVWIYVSAQILAGIIFMALSGAVFLTAAVIVQVIILALFLIGFMTAGLVRDQVKAFDDRVRQQTDFVRSASITANGLVDMAGEGELKEALKALYEDIRYSDPMSSPQLYGEEKQIEESLEILTSLVGSGQAAQAMELSDRIRIQIRQRNQKCAMYK